MVALHGPLCLLVTACFLYTRTPLADAQNEVHLSEKQSETNPLPPNPGIFTLLTRKRRQLNNAISDSDGDATVRNTQYVEEGPGVQRRAVNGLVPSIRQRSDFLEDGLSEGRSVDGQDLVRRKRQVRNQIVQGEGEEFHRIARDNAVALNSAEINLFDDEINENTFDGILSRVTRQARKKKGRNKKKGKKKKRNKKNRQNKAKKGKNANKGKGRKKALKKSNRNGVNKPTKAKKKKTSDKKPKPANKPKLNFEQTQTHSKSSMSKSHKRPTLLACLLESFLSGDIGEELSPYLRPLAYMMMGNENSMMDERMNSTMLMNNSSMESGGSNSSLMNSSMNYSLILLLQSKLNLSNKNGSMNNSIPNLRKLFFGNMSMDQDLMSFNTTENLNITEAELARIHSLLLHILYTLFSAEDGDYDLGGLSEAMETQYEMSLMQEKNSTTLMEEKENVTKCPALEISLLPGMNGRKAKRLIRDLKAGLMALLSGNKHGLFRALFGQPYKSSKMMYFMMRSNKTKHGKLKLPMLLVCLLESLLNSDSRDEMMTNITMYMNGDMDLAENDTTSNVPMMGMNSSMADAMITLRQMMMNISLSDDNLPLMNNTMLKESQLCQKKEINPMMVFAPMMNISSGNDTNTTMTEPNNAMMNMMAMMKMMMMEMMNSSFNGSMGNNTNNNMTEMDDPMMKMMMMMMEMMNHSLNESETITRMAPYFLLPASLGYLSKVQEIYAILTVNHLLQIIFDEVFSEDSDESSMEEIMMNNDSLSSNSSSEMMMVMGNMTAVTTDSLMNKTNITSVNNDTSEDEFEDMYTLEEVCPAVVMEFLPMMNDSTRLLVLKKLLWASKFFFCEDTEGLMETVMMSDDMVSMMGDVEDDDELMEMTDSVNMVV